MFDLVPEDQALKISPLQGKEMKETRELTPVKISEDKASMLRVKAEILPERVPLVDTSLDSVTKYIFQVFQKI